MEQLRPINLVAPGFRGLNLVESSNLLSPTYATQAQNAVVDQSGRLAARGGYSKLTTTDITGTPPVKSLFEYRKGDGTSSIVLAWDGGIANDISDPEGNDISGSVTDADGRWWFQNFNDKVIGFQSGQKPIVYNGTGTFATVVESVGTAPTSHRGIGYCGFGRVWALDADGQTIAYSDLLDETAWTGAGAGTIDMTSVWSDGQDEVTGIFGFNNRLVVFGRRHIVFWSDNGATSVLGLDPENLRVIDTIIGTGLLTQWSVQPAGETDLLYLSPNGVQSLQRVLLTNSTPVTSLTKKVRNQLLGLITRIQDIDSISSVYDPVEGFYLLSVPGDGGTAKAGLGAAFSSSKTYCLDQRFRYQDEEQDTLSIVTEWTLAPDSLLHTNDFRLLIGGEVGVGLYNGRSSDDDAAFRFIYQSPWLDLGEGFADYLKFLKRIGAVLFVQTATSIVFKWGIDFSESNNTLTTTVESDSLSEWGESEYGIAEWSGGLTLRILKVPARGNGQYFRVGIECDVDGDFAVQQFELFTKIGRLA